MAVTAPSTNEPEPRDDQWFNAVNTDLTDLDTRVDSKVAQTSWTAFTPTFENITIGNGTFNVAKYKRIQNIVFVQITFVLGSTSSVDGVVKVIPPTTAVGTINGNASMLDSGTQRYLAGIQDDIVLGQDNAAMNTTRPFTWTTNDRLYVDYFYEEA